MADMENPAAALAPQQTTEHKRGHARTYVGMVVSDKMEKTIVVVVQRLKPHPMYKKYIRRDKKLHVHDENNDANIGDKVEVIEISRPLSKTKRYRLRQIIERAK